MPTMSVFVFERQAQQLAGPFRQMHTKINNHFNWEAMWAVPQAHAIVANVRPDSEIALNLSAVANDPNVLQFVDDQFKNAPTNDHVRRPVRRGSIRTSYLTWDKALAAPATDITNKAAHQTWEIINTISIDFHCNTDWFLSALNGTITLYVFFYLDAQGKAGCRIEGWSVPVWDEEPLRPDGGAAGQVSQKIRAILERERPLFQSLLDTKLHVFAGDRAYSDLYSVPGTGITVGAPFVDNADNNVALCLVPR